MTYFKYLDLLLLKSFDEFTKGEDLQISSNPLYISAQEIRDSLSSSADFDLSGLDIIVEKLQLSSFEKDVLLILCAIEFEPKYERVYAYLQDDMNKKYPTVQLIAELLSNKKIKKKEILAYFISESKLSLLKLFEYIPLPNIHSKFQEPLKITSSLKSYLLDNVQIDEKIEEFCKLKTLSSKEDSASSDLLKTLEKTLKKSESYLFNLYGASKKESRLRAYSIAKHFGFSVLYISSSNIPHELGARELIKLLLRDAFLNTAVIFFEDFELFLEKRKQDEKVIFEELSQFSWISFFSTKSVWTPSHLPKELNFVSLENSLSCETILKKQWKEALKSVDRELSLNLVNNLAQHFKFTPEKIDDVTKLLNAQRVLGKKIRETDVLRMCRFRVEKNLEEYAQHLPSENTLEDIILPPKSQEQLYEIIMHYKHQFTIFEKWNFKKHFQSRGLGVLFSGASGTGKTMAASILANSLGLELYRIELSKIVSKYIGETEKNLSKIFEISEQSGVVLFFDEADALFGKRSEVKDSHDRYANLEVSYLLQKIEEYDGLVILASNFKNNIDEAFTRRMRFIIDFPLPNEQQRKNIWHKIFSKETDTSKVDFEYLAKHFKLSGANIRNAALYAAFNTLEKDDVLNMDSVISGVKSELHKIGKPFKDKEYKKE